MIYRREIDGLRAIAVLPVILFHAGIQTFRGGFVGVDVFFVISGYLITSIILAEKHAGTFSLLGFYERRARRILPALFFVMSACLLVSWFLLLPNDLKAFTKSAAHVTTFTSNILFKRQSGYFDTATELKPLIHTWSLAVEEQYYLIFPALFLALWRFGTKTIVGTLIVIASISFLYAEHKLLIKPSASFYLLPSRFWELLIGALAAFYLFLREKPNPNHNAVRQSLALLGLLMLAIPIFTYDQDTLFPGFHALLPTAGALLIVIFATDKTLVGKILGNKILVGMGLISYSAYLWHQPLFAFARQTSLVTPSNAMFYGLIALSLGLAYVSWRFVERPFRKKGSISQKQLLIFCILASVAFLAINYITKTHKGFPKRFAGADSHLANVNIGANGKYVAARFNQLHLSKFKSIAKPKILIIGDSYAQDLVNALYEGQLSEKLQLSTYFINKNCGNLYQEKNILKHVAGKYKAMCLRHNWYENKQLISLMKQADGIWLASSWEMWTAKRLSSSANKIEHQFGKKVLVFGRKDFGKIVPSKLIRIPPKSRLKYLNNLSKKHVATNDYMLHTLPLNKFIDVSYLLCKSDIRCNIFNEKGKLLTPDGHHVTPDGAKYYGEQIKHEAHIAEFLKHYVNHA